MVDLPVILMTIVDEKNRGYALGATEYLVKPVDRKKLVASGAVDPSLPFDDQFCCDAQRGISQNGVVGCNPRVEGARMRRRQFITFLGGAVGWPLAARAQQPAMHGRSIQINVRWAPASSNEESRLQVAPARWTLSASRS